MSRYIFWTNAHWWRILTQKDPWKTKKTEPVPKRYNSKSAPFQISTHMNGQEVHFWNHYLSRCWRPGIRHELHKFWYLIVRKTINEADIDHFIRFFEQTEYYQLIRSSRKLTSTTSSVSSRRLSAATSSVLGTSLNQFFASVFRLVKLDQPHGTILSQTYSHIDTFTDIQLANFLQMLAHLSSISFYNLLEHSKTL